MVKRKIDKGTAGKAVDFIQCLRQHKGEWAGKPLVLDNWQKKEIIEPLFGTLNDNGLRQYRTAYISLPRKNGKSTLAAAIALKLLLADNEPGAEIYSAAGDRDQASIVFNEATAMVKQSPVLTSQCKILESQKRIVFYKQASFYMAVSSAAELKFGYNAHGIIFDELHTQKTRDLWDALTSAGGSRRQPLVVAITTAGNRRNTICWEIYELAKKALKHPTDYPTFFSYICEVSRSESWKDKKMWKRANPASFRKWNEIEEAFNKAILSPAYQNTFRQLYLNQWTSQVSRWLDLDKWDISAGEIDTETLINQPCYGGLDLASSTDIAAFVLLFPVKQEDDTISYKVLPFFWIPEDTIHERSKKDLVPYDIWREDGLVVATPGNVIDYSFIEKSIKSLGEKYNIREIAFDRWGAIQLVENLEADGFIMIPMWQGFRSMSPPTCELLTNVLASKIHHGGNPVLRWMADNMVIRQNAAGNVKPDKSKSTERIDGMVALIMALDRALRHVYKEDIKRKSIYEERGILFV